MLRALSEIYGNRTYYTTIKETRLMFHILNQIIFKGKCKPFRNITIIKRRGQLACTEPVWYKDSPIRHCYLELNPKFLNFKTYLSVLAHEMVHSFEFVNQKRAPSHGKFFFIWKKRIENQGLDFGIQLNDVV